VLTCPRLLGVAVQILFSFGLLSTEHSFLAKLAKSDFYSAHRLSNTRLFPPPRRIVPPILEERPLPRDFHQEPVSPLLPQGTGTPANRTLPTEY
jgi:hypothetical protein